MRAFSRCDEHGLVFLVISGLLIVVASQSTGSRSMLSSRGTWAYLL